MLARRDWPGSLLAGRLGVSERTVRRDVDRPAHLGGCSHITWWFEPAAGTWSAGTPPGRTGGPTASTGSNGPRFTPREVPGSDVASFLAARFKGSTTADVWPCQGEVILDLPVSAAEHSGRRARCGADVDGAALSRPSGSA
ncbi:hypothetical protein Amsp01_079190 [Amycolatopsis sp. NBRC 101858]|nr:hypothetical protein Amsp01_079190 [Amycolatopsis sp. NBRC 101858]